MALFRNFYLCPDPNCQHDWEDVWSAMCDDDCPECGKRHISPYRSEDEPEEEWEEEWDTDPENIYDLPGIRQSIEEDRK